MRITKKWLYAIVATLLALVLALIFAGCSLTGQQAVDWAEQAGVLKAEVLSETQKLIDADGDGDPDYVDKIQEVEYKAGATAEAAAESIPYGKTALGIIGFIAGILGIGKVRRYIRENFKNPTPNKQ